MIWDDSKSVAKITKNWKDANSYCKELSLDGYIDWRLPTATELEDTIDYSEYFYYAKKTYFKNHGYFYMSATNFFTNPVFATNNSAYYAVSYGVTLVLDKNKPMNVRCVRGIQKKINFSEKIEWQNNNKLIKKKWKDAIEYCENLTKNQHNDWRLPNINELKSIIDRNVSKPPAINHIFKKTALHWDYWSSTTPQSSKSLALTVDFTYGTINFTLWKGEKAYVRCVRDTTKHRSQSMP